MTNDKKTKRQKTYIKIKIKIKIKTIQREG